jgi:hypothetical protein
MTARAPVGNAHECFEPRKDERAEPPRLIFWDGSYVGRIAVIVTPRTQEVRDESSPTVVRKHEPTFAPFPRCSISCNRKVELPTLAVDVERIGLNGHTENVVAVSRGCSQNSADLPMVCGHKIDCQSGV